MNINFTPFFEEVIQEKVASGEYQNASEVVRDAMRLLVERDKLREAKIRDVRAAIQEGVESGDPVPFDIERIIDKGDTKRAERKQARGRHV